MNPYPKRYRDWSLHFNFTKDGETETRERRFLFESDEEAQRFQKMFEDYIQMKHTPSKSFRLVYDAETALQSVKDMIEEYGELS